MFIIMKLEILCVMIVLSRNPNKKEALIQRLSNVNFKYHVIKSVIDIVSLCGEK